MISAYHLADGRCVRIVRRRDGVVLVATWDDELEPVVFFGCFNVTEKHISRALEGWEEGTE